MSALPVSLNVWLRRVSVVPNALLYVSSASTKAFFTACARIAAPCTRRISASTFAKKARADASALLTVFSENTVRFPIVKVCSVKVTFSAAACRAEELCVMVHSVGTASITPITGCDSLPGVALSSSMRSASRAWK
jgi:hypothetical protein